MERVASSLVKATAQLGDPQIVRVLVKSLAITLLVLLAGGASLLVALYQALTTWGGAWGTAWSAEISGILAVLATILAAWLLFRIIALAVLQFFADEIVQAVEQRHYPEAAGTRRDLPFREDFGNSLRSIVYAITVNLLAAPVALLLIFTAIGPALVFLTANAVLLGRELTDMAWHRHREPTDRQSPVAPLERLMLGGAIAGLMLVPFLNLLAPIIGAAAGTHLTRQSIRRSVDA